MSNNVHVLHSVPELERLVRVTSKPLVVDFWAPWCGPCKAFAPALEEAAAELAEDAYVTKVNVDDLPELAREYGVSSIPTVLYFVSGRLIDRQVGVSPKESVVGRVRSLVAAA